MVKVKEGLGLVLVHMWFAHIIQLTYFAFYTKKDNLEFSLPSCNTLASWHPVCFHANLSGLHPALPDLLSSSPSSRLVSL